MRYVFILSLLLVFTLPAFAEESSPGGLSYTTLGARKERTGGHMNYKAMKYEDTELKYKGTLEKKGEGEENAETPPPDEAAADKVWDKYKQLAAGTYKDPAAPKKSEEPAAKDAEEKPASGLAGIIEQYNKNKTQRSQMHTISVSPPESLEKKPEAPTNEDKSGQEEDEPEQKSRD